ncbi:MAG: hypothetical protein Q9210_000972 [Variospora velana]
MDPFTVLLSAVVGALVSTKEVWKALQWMQKVYEIYTEGDKFLQSIALECYIYGDSIKTIGHWLKKNQSATTLTRQMRTTHTAIALVQVSMANVSRDLNRFRDGGDVKITKDTRLSRQKRDMKLFQQFIRNKAKHQWFTEIMGIHLIELRAHAATLHLTLDIIKLAGHSPDQKEKEPEKLEDQTGRLEKRLMLRQFLTKALDIKRSEVVGFSGREDTDQPFSTASPSSVYVTPRKLTFYDVVQLARQQAYVEKTQRSNEDLIDLSDTPESPPQPPASASFQSDLTLLHSSNPEPSQHISPDPSVSGPVKMNSLGERANEQPSIAELDTAWPPNLPTSDLAGLVELDAAPAISHGKGAAEPIDQVRSQIYELSRSLNDRDVNQEQPGLEVTGTGSSSTGHSVTKGAIELPGQPQQVGALLDAPTDENVEVRSFVSSAAPSMFSHSTSLTGATTCSMPGITEEDMQARNPSLPRLPSSAITIAPSGPLVQKNPAISVRTENTLGISYASSTKMTQEVPTKLQHIPSGDHVSLATSPPQLAHIDEPDENGFPWIVQAARDGSEDIIRKLLVSGADIQAAHTSTRRNALSEASLQGHTKVVDLLIDEGCSLEQADTNGNTALHYACQQGHLAIAKSLLTHDASIDVLGSAGRSALHFAMEAPTHQNVVMLLIQHKANVNARDASSRTPLHISAQEGNGSMCNHLLNEGAQLDAREAQSRTPLHIACEAGHYELVQMMLDRSQLHPTEMSFLAAFFGAVEHGHVRIAESFFSRGLRLPELRRDRHQPLTLAAKSGYQAMVDLMIHEGCDVYARDDNGWNPLHFASYHGHYQIIDGLLTSGVSAKATTSRKETPLLLAVKGSHFPVAERLLRNGIDSSLVNTEDERGQQPVHHAVRAGSLETFNLLMSNGGKVNQENSFGWRPLHIATAYGHSTLVDALLQRGANIEEKLGSSSIKKDQTHKIVQEGYWQEARWPYPGSRALHLACEYGHVEIANLLIGKGAKMESSCGEGWQPLHHATFFGSSTLVETLLQGGVNPHATTNEGKNASSLGFCTTGSPIPEVETHRIQTLLGEAMNKVKKPRNFKVGLKKASTVEDKKNHLRAAAFSMMVVARPHLQKADTTAQISHRASTTPDMAASSHRPRLQHLPYTSPLPVTDPPPDSTSLYPPNPSIPTSQSEMELPPLSSTLELNRRSIDTATPSINAAASNSATNKAPQTSGPDTAAAAPVPPEGKQLVTPPNPILKRRPTFGLSKGKTGTETTKLNFASIGKPTFEIGTKTLELSKQGIEMTRQGLDFGKKGVEAIQGLEVGKQSREKWEKGVDISKQKYKTATGKFARKGKGGDEKKKGKVKAAGVSLEREKEAGEIAGEKGTTAERIEEEEDMESDDAKSDFSLGGFLEVGKVR